MAWTVEAAESAGYTVDRHCYPWVGYKGARFAPDGPTIVVVTPAFPPAEAETVEDDGEDHLLADLQDLAEELHRCPVCCRLWSGHEDYTGRALCVPVIPVSKALDLMRSFLPE